MAALARMGPEKGRALWREYRRTGDPALRNRLVLAYAPIVKAVAYRKVREMPAHTEVDDLVSCGLEALVRAIDRFDPARGATLEQYVWTRVNGAVLDELRAQDWVPRSVRRWERDISRATREFAVVHGRPPRPYEVADTLGISVSELGRHERDIARTAVGSLNAAVLPGGDDDALERLDLLADPDPSVDPVAAATARERGRRLRAAFGALPRREQEVAVLLYVMELTMAEAGRVLDVSESRVSQLHRRLMIRLRRALRDDRNLFAGALAS
jgi:RNA polymerase sigma factor FliA